MTTPDASTHSDTPDASTDAPTELTVTGMSCTSCAASVETALNQQAGITATVDYATSSAHVSRGPGAPGVAELIAVVEGLGYGAIPVS